MEQLKLADVRTEEITAMTWYRRRWIAVPIVSASLLMISFLSGCRAINISTDYSLDERKGAGVAVLSLTQSGLPSRFNMWVNIRGVDNNYKNSVPVSDLFASSDWRCPFLGTATEDAPCGRLAIIELQQGEYEFYSWQGSTGGGPGAFTVDVGSINDFSKRFRVAAGKAVYLGNVHFSVVGIGQFGSRGGTYRMKISDMRHRDLPLLYQKNPNITSDSVVVNVLPD